MRGRDRNGEEKVGKQYQSGESKKKEKDEVRRVREEEIETERKYNIMNCNMALHNILQ